MNIAVTLAAVCAILTLYMGLTQLGIHLSRRQSSYSLSFALTCGVMTVYDVITIGYYLARSPEAAIAWQQAQLALLALVSLLLLEFIARLTRRVGQTAKWFFRLSLGLLALLQGLNPAGLCWRLAGARPLVVDLPGTLSQTYHPAVAGPICLLQVITGCVLGVYLLKITWLAWRNDQNRTAKSLFICTLIILIGLLNDSLVMSRAIDSLYLLELAYLSAILAVTYAMVTAVAQAAATSRALAQTEAELRELNQNLEELVRARTTELETANQMLKDEIEVRREFEDKLEEAFEEIRTISITDPLTGSFNRHYLTENLPAEIKRAERYSSDLCLIMCDIDHFKHVNDTYGHRAGDLVLSAFAHSLKTQLRDKIDWIARYGGEEFVITLPESKLADGLALAERLRRSIHDLSVFEGMSEIKITASFGVAELTPGQKAEELLNAADQELYRAKSEGRDCVRPRYGVNQP